MNTRRFILSVVQEVTSLNYCAVTVDALDFADALTKTAALDLTKQWKTDRRNDTRKNIRVKCITDKIDAFFINDFDECDDLFEVGHLLDAELIDDSP